MDLANAAVVREAVAMLAPAPGERVLDAGCGTGAALAAVRKAAGSCTLAGIDRSEVMVRAARKRLGPAVELQTCSIEQASLIEGAFDAALMLNVLYFCDPASAMIEQVRRSLRPGGRLVSYVTHRKTMVGWRFAREGLHRLFDADELRDLLLRGGFADHSVAVSERPVARGVQGLFAIAIA